ncbi:hypothetical protein Ddye_005405 [Dipteronia dyeriana]|uniref:Uncharacterized protein n=1 Tax=Dipteronia dyeriana TaxID=168575 RepID=A0AAE0CPN7_9ROSI|nr:hypothetical protein Ddye_005405 [Dipteronia dyeriana]
MDIQNHSSKQPLSVAILKQNIHKKSSINNTTIFSGFSNNDLYEFNSVASPVYLVVIVGLLSLVNNSGLYLYRLSIGVGSGLSLLPVFTVIVIGSSWSSLSDVPRRLNPQSVLSLSLIRKNLFVHFVLDPIAISDSAAEVSFAARFGCLVLIENQSRTRIRALVRTAQSGIQVKPSKDPIDSKIRSKWDPKHSRARIRALVRSAQSGIQAKPSKDLSFSKIRPKWAPKEALFQTQIVNSFLWDDKEPSLDCDDAFVPSLPESSSQSEVVKLQQKKSIVMDLKDTEQRLNDSLELIKENISMVVAKLAIQSIEMQ